jgi:protein-disulfide isomerase
MHEAIYANQHRLGLPLLIALAANLDLSPITLRDALASGIHATKVQTDFIGGVRSGVNGTPAFFVNGVRYDSPFGVNGLAAAIDRVLLTAA